MRMIMRAAVVAAIVAMPGVASAAAFQNGSFETLAAGVDYPGAGDLGTFYAPSTDIAGWTVTDGSVDYIENGFWQASDGSFSLDMSGASQGAIEQTFDTVAGQDYTVTFDLSKNPGIDAATLRVGAGGSSQDFDYLFANSSANMAWAPQTFSFTAQGTATTLSFASLNPGVAGPALDNVSVVANAGAVPEPASWALMILGFGAVGAGLRRRRAAAVTFA